MTTHARYIITNRHLKIFSGLYCSETFAQAAKREISERMPELEWTGEVLGHYVLSRGLLGVDIRVPGLVAFDFIRQRYPQFIAP